MKNNIQRIVSFCTSLLEDSQEDIDSIIQNYKDIIDNNKDNLPKIKKYFDILKTQYGIDYQNQIHNKNLSDNDKLSQPIDLCHLLTVHNFNDRSNYKKYIRQIYLARDIKYVEDPKYTSLQDQDILFFSIDLDFKIDFKNKASDNAHTISDTVTIEHDPLINTFIHELGHVYESQVLKYKGMVYSNDQRYSLSSYGLMNTSECFAENFMYFFLYPKTLKKYLPEVYNELNTIINSKWKITTNKLIKDL